MIGVLVEHDIVLVPEPIIAVRIIVRSDAEVRATKKEALGPSAAEPEDVVGAKPKREASMLPRTIHMVVGIVAARIVSDPLAVFVNVGRIGMPWPIGEFSVFRRRILGRTVVRSRSWRRLLHARRLNCPSSGRRAVSGDRPAAMFLSFVLRKAAQGNNQQHSQEPWSSAHVSPFSGWRSASVPTAIAERAAFDLARQSPQEERTNA
jgi:hypothetical protein